jgi:hypothetical protein
LIGSGYAVSLSWLYNSGNVTGATTAGSIAVGGVAGLLDSSTINGVANIGNVVGRQYVSGGVGFAKTNSNASAAFSNFANRGSVRGVADIGSAIGNATLVYGLTLSNTVNYSANTIIDCTTNCGAVIGSASGGTLTRTSVYSVTPTGTTSNSLGTNLGLSLSSFTTASSFIAAPPTSGSAFNTAYWDYSLNFGGTTGVAWLSGMP